MSEKEVLGLEDKRFGAMIKGDVNALDAMVHDQLLYTHSSGNTDTKPSWLESIKSGKTKYKAVNCSDRKVRLFGDVALITGRAAIEAEIGGQPIAFSWSLPLPASAVPLQRRLADKYRNVQGTISAHSLRI
jgi:hypothetical protein